MIGQTMIQTSPSWQAPSVNGVWSSADWAAALLAYLPNVPITTNNIQNIQRWMQLENSGSNFLHGNDPLNTTLGANNFAFQNVFAGLIQTAGTITQPNMSGIYNALKANAPWPVFSQALVNSPWDAGHYGGSARAIANTPLQSGSMAAPNLPNGGNTTGGIGTNSNGTVSTSSASVLGELGTLLGDVTSKTLWQRAGMFTLGAAFVLIGLSLFVSTTGAGKTAIGAIAK